MEPLDPDILFSPAARRRVIAREGEVLDVVESTMDEVRRRAEAGAPDGYAVLAEHQMAGRGRTGAWECPEGEGLLVSVLLRLGMSASERFLSGLLGAVAAAEALGQFLPEVGIKWPNDIVARVGGSERLWVRKLGGVLVEQAPQGDAAPAHILGIGLNVNQVREGLPSGAEVSATSLRAELGRPVDRTALCAKLFDELDNWYAKLRRGYPEALLARWRTLSCLLGHGVRARLAGGEVRGTEVWGTVVGLRATGELILRTESGEVLLLTSDRATLLLGRPGA